MRPCSGLLAAALADPNTELAQIDLFDVLLNDGVTEFHWSSYDDDITYLGTTYQSAGPFIRYSDLSVTNTMTVPSMTCNILATQASFNGSLDIMSQVMQGLFDGSIFSYQRLFVPRGTLDLSLGTIPLFVGQCGPAEVDGLKITLRVKGCNNLLDQYGPRNVYQVQCLHTFCDAGCTLLRAAFTLPYVVGTTPAPSSTFIPWASSPASPELYELGTITFTGGAASGSRRGIVAADATGLFLEYPLYNVPAPGDSFTAFQGCTKTQTICNSRSNIQNWRGFKFIPPATTAV